MLLGLIGCFIPIIPSPITSWFGFLVLYFSSNVIIESDFLIITLVISILIFLADFILPMLTAKKFGGSKKGFRNWNWTIFRFFYYGSKWSIS